MNNTKSLIKSLVACGVAVAFGACAADPKPADVAAALKRSANWHLSDPSGIDTRDWVIAPLYDGLLHVAQTTGYAKYLAAVLRFGTQSGWMPDNRLYHADDFAVGHAWLDVYAMNKTRTERLEPNTVPELAVSPPAIPKTK